MLLLKKINKITDPACEPLVCLVQHQSQLKLIQTLLGARDSADVNLSSFDFTGPMPYCTKCSSALVI